MKESFVDRDHTAIERYWHQSYIQHNPSMSNGHQGLKDLLKFIKPGFKWVPGIFLEANNLVIVNSQVAPLIVVDIFGSRTGK